MRIGFPLIQKYRPGLSGLCLIRKFRQAQLHQKARQTLINLGGTGELEPVRKISILKRKRSVSAPCIQHKEAETMQRANATETKTFQHVSFLQAKYHTGEKVTHLCAYLLIRAY